MEGCGVCVRHFVLGCVALLCVGKGPDQTRFELELECERVRVNNVCVLRRAVRCGQCGAQVRRRGPALRARPFFALALLCLKIQNGTPDAGDGGRTHPRPRRVVSRRVAWLFQLSLLVSMARERRCACVTRASRWSAGAAATASAPCLGGGRSAWGCQ